MTTDPALSDLLDAAVTAVGGEARPGQQQMADAVADALETGEHLLVQAGTGTGKSLAYLVPAIAHHDSVVVATATIALQRQLIDRDLPRLVDALTPLLGRRPTFAMLKGRSNYVCQHRLHSGEQVPDDQEALFDPAPTSKAGRDVVRIRAWAETTQTGDRDEVVPAPDDRAWRSLSVTPHECLGAQRCPFTDDCFAELARERAKDSDVVVTNHAMLAIDSLSEARLLPEVDVVIVDEAHELADRATGAVTDELTAALVERAGRRSRKHAGEAPAEMLADAAAALATALEEAPEGRLVTLEGSLFDALVAVRDAGHDALSAMGGSGGGSDGDDVAVRVRAKAAVEEVYEVTGRIVAAAERDVVWVTRSERRPPSIWRAPLFVGGPLREGLFDDRTVILTSATLELGGGFEPIARGLGLTGEGAPAWRGLDVGSPFEYEKQAILYVASKLPPPGRDGLSEAALDEMASLVEAAGGRTLGLFSSMRAAQQATEEMRERLDLPILCQGDDATGELVRQFAADARTCLFGTLSLWQGVDVPGSALQLVLIDRLPFPRPDDPLASARQRFVESSGGNGFMTIAATQASLRLAQGAGRLIRNATDKGVVAVLDSRLANARYAGFVRASLPPMWSTTDGELVRASLRAIDASAPEPLPVAESTLVAAGSAVDADNRDGDSADRRRRRWTEAEEQQLLEGFRAGTPVALLADELGRTSGAVVSRLKEHQALGRVLWGEGQRVGDDDKRLAYALTAVPAGAWVDLETVAAALALDDWQVEQRDPLTLHVQHGEADALVGVGAAESMLLGEATSRWLVRVDPGDPATDVPTGISGAILPPPRTDPTAPLIKVKCR
jgi:ATP-dependent DNA helicase DinG